MAAKYRFRFTNEIPMGNIAQRLLLAAINTENVFGEAAMRLDAKFRIDKAARIVEIDRDTEIGRHIAKLFVSYIAKEFGNGCYAVERVAEPEDPVGDGVTPSTETRCGAS